LEHAKFTNGVFELGQFFWAEFRSRLGGVGDDIVGINKLKSCTGDISARSGPVLREKHVNTAI
jgi:hypothetical protein